MAILRINSHWRDSARRPKLFIIEAQSAFPVLLFLVHLRWWTFWVALITTLFFAILEHYGFTVRLFLRVFRAYLAGPRVYSRPWWREEKLW